MITFRNSMKYFLCILSVMLVFSLVSCGGSASSTGADGGVSGWGYYDFFNGHTWSLVNEAGNGKTSFIFAKTKVTRKEFTLQSGNWVETYSSSEKPYTLSNITDSGTHGTINTEDIFSNNPAAYTFLTTNTVILSFNNQAYTYTSEN